MKKIALALAATLASAPAMAGVYINAESNGSYTGNNFTGRATDLHLGCLLYTSPSPRDRG